MNREEIISKGFYTYPQLKGYISVKQYIVLREDNKKYLTLRMENEHGDRATGLTLNVRQYDSASRFLATERVDAADIKVNTDGTFNLGRKINLREECERFEVDVVSMTFGAYRYLVRNGEVIPVFSLDDDDKDQDKAEVTYKMRKGSHKVSRRNHVSPKIFVVLSIVALMLVSVFAVFQVLDFAKREVVFTLDHIEYSFETDNHVDGPIRIDRYKGLLGNIVIPETIEGHKVARISSNAFSGTWIGSVTVQGETVIEEHAFASCSFLKSAELEKVTSVGDYAFYGCSSLERVAMNSATTVIGVSSFEKCTSLKDVVLPESLKEVKSRAFFGCAALETMTIPATVENIGEGILSECRRLKSLSVPFVGENIETQKTLEYFFFNGEKAVTPTNDPLDLTISNYDKVLPEMFMNCKYLGTVSFEKEVVEIGDRAFYGCTKLTGVDITNELLSLGESAFEKCTSLKSVLVSANVKEIKPRTFAKCSDLVSVEIDGNLVSVGENAFEDCISLTVLKIPSTVKTIDKGAFVGCTALTDLTVPFLGANESEPAGIDTWFLEPNKKLKKITVLRGKTISDGAFKNCIALEEVNLPDVVTEIGKTAFMNCSSLKEFTVPMGVTTIAEQSFKECVSLEKIVLSNKVATISTRAFEGCTSLKTIQIPENSEVTDDPDYIYKTDMIHTIEPYAFLGCTSLETLYISANLSVIPEGMLMDCTALESVTMPSTLRKIDAKAFANCHSLVKIELPESITYLGAEAFSGCSSIETLVVPTDPDDSSKVVGMGEKVFSGCTSLTSLTLPDLRTTEADIAPLVYFFDGETEDGPANIPDSLTYVALTQSEYVAPSAFANCEKIQKIELPISVGIIGAFAFKNCKSLTTLTIPIYTRGIGQHAFSGCMSLRELSVPILNSGNEEEGGFKFWFEEIPHTLAIVRITNTTQIPKYAFSGASDIKEVIFDSEIEFIGEYAFYNCSNLNKITLPRTLSYIGDNSFEGCYKLYEVINNSDRRFDMDKKEDDATGLTKHALALYEMGENPEKITIDGFEFLHTKEEGWYLIGYNGTSKNWRLPDSSALGTYKIANYVFYRNDTVESVFIPWNIDKFGIGMFAYCSNLESVEWQKNTSVTSIPQSAFAYCTSLKYVDLPECTQTIDAFAFANCNSLMQIQLYSALEVIGDSAFYGCTGMLEIVNNSALDIYGTIGQEDNTFGYIAQYALNVPTAPSLLEETVVDGDITYRFARVNNAWYLYRIDLGDISSDTVIKLPELNRVDGKKYSVIKDALNVDVEGFIIPTSVSRISDESLTIACSTSSTIYYMGSEDEWSTLVDDCNATVYYYARCVHNEGQWSYGNDGDIVVEVNEDAFNEAGVCSACGAKR